MKTTTLGLVWGRLSLISTAAFLTASAFALKLVEYFPVADDVCLAIIIPHVHPTTPISGGFCCRAVCVGMRPLVFWVLCVDMLQRQ